MAAWPKESEAGCRNPLREVTPAWSSPTFAERCRTQHGSDFTRLPLGAELLVSFPEVFSANGAVEPLCLSPLHPGDVSFRCLKLPVSPVL